MASHQGQHEHLGRCHLRRIGCKPAAAGVAEVMHFEKDVTLLGRRREVVDYFLSSRGGAGDCVSRLHARVIRAPGAYQLVDCSLTGVYVNDTRIGGKVILQKGDIVVFGHPTERHLKPGTRVRQPNSQLCFLFEHCCCRADHDERRSSVPQVPSPPSASPEDPQLGSDLVFEESVSLPARPPAARTRQDIPRDAGVPAELGACPGEHEAPAAAPSLPFNSVGSATSSANCSVSTNFTDMTSNRFEERAGESPAMSDAAQEGCALLQPLFLRSASPEYGLMSRDSAGTAESVQLAALWPQEHVSGEGKLINPDLLSVEQSEGQAYASRSIQKSCRPFLEEKRNSEVEMEVYSAASPHEDPVVPRDIERADDEAAAGTSVLRGWEGSDSELVLMETAVEKCTAEMVGYETAETSGLGTRPMNQLEAAKEDVNNVPLGRSYEGKATEKAGPHAGTSEDRQEPGARAQDAPRQTPCFTEMEMYEYYPKEENYSTNSSTDAVADIRNDSENGNPIEIKKALEGQHDAVEQQEDERGAEHAGVAGAAAAEELPSAAREAPRGAQGPQPEPGLPRRALCSESHHDPVSAPKEKSVVANETEKQVIGKSAGRGSYPLADREVALGLPNESPEREVQQPGPACDRGGSAESNHAEVIAAENTGCGGEPCETHGFDGQSAPRRRVLAADAEGAWPVDPARCHAQDAPRKQHAARAAPPRAGTAPTWAPGHDGDDGDGDDGGGAVLPQSGAAGNADAGTAQAVMPGSGALAALGSGGEEVAVGSRVAGDRRAVKGTVDAAVPETQPAPQRAGGSAPGARGRTDAERAQPRSAHPVPPLSEGEMPREAGGDFRTNETKHLQGSGSREEMEEADVETDGLILAWDVEGKCENREYGDSGMQGDVSPVVDDIDVSRTDVGTRLQKKRKTSSLSTDPLEDGQHNTSTKRNRCEEDGAAGPPGAALPPRGAAGARDGTVCDGANAGPSNGVSDGGETGPAGPAQAAEPFAGLGTCSRGTASAASCSPNAGAFWENPEGELLQVTNSDSSLSLGEIPSGLQHNGCAEQEQPLGGDQSLLLAAEQENPGRKATEISVVGSVEATSDSGSDQRLDPAEGQEPACVREPHEGNQSGSDPESPLNDMGSELQEQPGELQNQQEADACAAQPPDLERNVDLESEGDFVPLSLYPEDSAVEDAVLDEGDKENRSVEDLMATGLEGSDDSSIYQDGYGIAPQAPWRGASEEEEGSSAGMCSTVTEHAGSCKENRSEELKEIGRDPADVAEFCRGGQFQFRLQDLEAGKDENNGRRREMFPVKGVSEGGVATRDADSVSRSSVGCGEPRGSGTQSRGAAAAGPAAGAAEAAERGAERASRPRSGAEHGLPAVGMTATLCPSRGCVAAAEKSRVLIENAAPGEKEETPAAEEHGSVGSYCDCNSVGLPAPPEQVAAESRDGCSSETSGSADSSPFQSGEASEEDWPAETVLLHDAAREGGAEAPAAPSQLPRAAEDSPVGKVQPELWPGAPEPGRAARAGELLRGQGERPGPEPRAARAQSSPAGSTAAALRALEPCLARGMHWCEEGDARAPGEESKRDGSSTRLKRQVPENEGLGASDSDDEQLSQKRRCPMAPASAQEPGASKAGAAACGERERRAAAATGRQFHQGRPAARAAEAAEQQGSRGYVARLVRQFFQGAGGRAERARDDTRAVAVLAEPPGAGATGATDGQGALQPGAEPAALVLPSQCGAAGSDTDGQGALQPSAEPSILVPPSQRGAACSDADEEGTLQPSTEPAVLALLSQCGAAGSDEDEEGALQPSAEPSILVPPSQRGAAGSDADEEGALQPSTEPAVLALPSQCGAAGSDAAEEGALQPSTEPAVLALPLQCSAAGSDADEEGALQPSAEPAVLAASSQRGAAGSDADEEGALQPSTEPDVLALPSQCGAACSDADKEGALQPSAEPAVLALPSQRGAAGSDADEEGALQPSAEPSILVLPSQRGAAGTSADEEGALQPSTEPAVLALPSQRGAAGTSADEEGALQPSAEPAVLAAPSPRGAAGSDASGAPCSPCGSLSDEEQFQSSLCSALDHRRASDSSPASPSALSLRSAGSPPFLFSDLSNSSTDGGCCQAPAQGSDGASGGTGAAGLWAGPCPDSCEAPEALPGFAACCAETPAERWTDGDANSASYRVVASTENGPCRTEPGRQPRADGGAGRLGHEAAPSAPQRCTGAPAPSAAASGADSAAPASPPLPLGWTDCRAGAPLAWGSGSWAEGPGAPGTAANAVSQTCFQRRPSAKEPGDGRGASRPGEAGGSPASQTGRDLGNAEILGSAFPASAQQGLPAAVPDGLPPARLAIRPREEEEEDAPGPSPAPAPAPSAPGAGPEERPWARPPAAPAPRAPGAAGAPASPAAASVEPRAEQDPAAWTLPCAPRSSGDLCGGERSGAKGRSSGRAASGSRRDWAASQGDIEAQLRRCQAVLADVAAVLRAVEGIDGAHMEEWREQIDKLQRGTKMPRTYIAVVGNTGAGKSSLLNALLGEEAVLPTSAMRACTAATVEISGAAEGSAYEAAVEFLSKEEWFGELQALLKDMKDKSGKLKKRCPDRKTEAGAAYSRVKAVYGTVAELAELEKLQEVTQHLGTVKHVSAATATDFRSKIEKFVDSRTDNLRDMKGGEFWPIVKCVKIRVPKADVLKTGAVLVDLPGIRDSNAARDNTAKEYLKNCNAVWVVANINRAVDDKTAKEMLNINLRRQLLMDGQYGRLAFVCTKTDAFNISEIISDLDLKDEIVPIERELEVLETQRGQTELEKEGLYAELQQEQQGQGPRVRNSASFQKENELRKKILEKELKISALLKEKEAKLHTISLICVQSRNQYSKQRIWQDFISGLQEMKRKAALADCEEDEYEEEMEDEELSTALASDAGEAAAQHNKLQVFTVSSTEYLKLHGKLLREGRAQVFQDDEDTEIPALRRFAVRSALQHSMVETEKLIRDVTRVISQVVNYLTNQRAEDHSQRAQVQEIVQTSLSRVPELLQEAVSGGVREIQYFFSDLLLSHLKRGARKAEDVCEEKVRSWGLPHCGYPYATYRAACARRGIYSSVACGFVDFNEQLTEPIYSTVSMTWNEVFSSQLGESIEQFSKAVLDKLKQFFEELRDKLPAKGRDTHLVNLIEQQQTEAAQALLHNFILDQIEYISKRQRDISRILTPEVQASMEPIYAVCNQLNGPGSFQRMKDLMWDYIHKHKQSMFSTATYKLQQQLELLQQYICATFECLVQDLNKSLARQFEPMLKTVQKNDRVIPELVSICGKVQQLCKLSRVDYVLPSPGHIGGGSGSACPEDAPEGSAEPPDFVGRCRLVRLGTWHLAHVTSVQISMQEITIGFRGNVSLTVPFRSVYLCECCFHLYYLNLHMSPEGTKDIYTRWGAQAATANLGNVEVLVVLETPEVPGSFRRLMEFVSERRSGTAWFRELSLQQGREKLESLQVYYTATESKYALGEELEEIPASGFPENAGAAGPCARPWLPADSRKRGMDGPPHAGKRPRGGAGEKGPAAAPAGSLLPSQQGPGSSAEPRGGSSTPGWSGARAQGWRPRGTAPCRGPASPKAEVKQEPDALVGPSAPPQQPQPVCFIPAALLKVETCENQRPAAPGLPGAPGEEGAGQCPAAPGAGGGEAEEAALERAFP